MLTMERIKQIRTIWNQFIITDKRVYHTKGNELNNINEL